MDDQDRRSAQVVRPRREVLELTAGPDRPRSPVAAALRRPYTIPAAMVAVLAVVVAIVVASGGLTGSETPQPAAGQADHSAQPVDSIPAPAATPSPAVAPTTAATKASTSPGGGVLRPPTQLKLRDDRRTITVTWTDPTRGVATAAVSIARPDEDPVIVAPVAAGVTHYTQTGLSPDFDYCFTVTLIYGPDRVKAADPVCTERG